MMPVATSNSESELGNNLKLRDKGRSDMKCQRNLNEKLVVRNSNMEHTCDITNHPQSRSHPRSEFEADATGTLLWMKCQWSRRDALPEALLIANAVQMYLKRRAGVMKRWFSDAAAARRAMCLSNCASLKCTRHGLAWGSGFAGASSSATRESSSCTLCDCSPELRVHSLRMTNPHV